MVLTSTSVQKVITMWDVLLVNFMRQSLLFFVKEPGYNIMIMSTISGLTFLEGTKE